MRRQPELSIFNLQTQWVLNPYTAERRDVSENTPPEAQEISQGRGFCTPRPERLPEGEARGQSRGPRGAKSPHKGNLEGRGGCIFRYIPTRGSVRTFFHHYQGTIDFVAWQQMALASVRLIHSTYALVLIESTFMLLGTLITLDSLTMHCCFETGQASYSVRFTERHKIENGLKVIDSIFFSTQILSTSLKDSS